jgi:hypothetical protein
LQFKGKGEAKDATGAQGHKLSLLNGLGYYSFFFFILILKIRKQVVGSLEGWKVGRQAYQAT